MEQAETIEGQKALIAEQEQTIRACVVEMQEQGKSVVKNFDEQTGNLQKNGLELDKALIERRNWLETASNDDIEQKAPAAVLQMLRPISDAITVVAMAAAAMASAIADSVSRSVQEKQKMLTALTRQIKEQSIWKSTKGAILSLVNKPANRQVEELQEELREVRAEAEEAKAAFEKQNAAIAESLRAEEANSHSLLIRLNDAERRNKALWEALNKEEATNAALREELRTEKDAHKKTIQEKESLSNGSAPSPSAWSTTPVPNFGSGMSPGDSPASSASSFGLQLLTRRKNGPPNAQLSRRKPKWPRNRQH